MFVLCSFYRRRPMYVAGRRKRRTTLQKLFDAYVKQNETCSRFDVFVALCCITIKQRIKPIGLRYLKKKEKEIRYKRPQNLGTYVCNPI